MNTFSLPAARLLRLSSTLCLVAFAAGCGAKATPSETTSDDVAATDVTADAVDDATAGTDATADTVTSDVATGDADTSDIPKFNYIPLNDNACKVEEAPDTVIEKAKAAVAALLQNHSTTVGQDLELCADKPENQCPACNIQDDPFVQLLREMDKTVGQFGTVPGDSFEVYFREALRYSYRFPLVSWASCDALPAGTCPDGANAHVVLTQGKRQPCADGTAAKDCWHMSVESESFDETCLKFTMNLYG